MCVTTNTITICDGSAFPKPPSHGDAPLSPNGASHFELFVEPAISRRRRRPTIEAGYRKTAEFHGVLLELSLMNDGARPFRGREGKPSMATEILLKDLRQ